MIHHPLRHQSTVSVGLASTTLLTPNPRRAAIIIGAPLANRVTISFIGPAVLDQGITLYPLGPPLVLTDDIIRGALREDIFAISVVAPQNVTVVEIFWP